MFIYLTASFLLMRVELKKRAWPTHNRIRRFTDWLLKKRYGVEQHVDEDKVRFLRKQKASLAKIEHAFEADNQIMGNQLFDEAIEAGVFFPPPKILANHLLEAAASRYSIAATQATSAKDKFALFKTAVVGKYEEAKQLLPAKSEKDYYFALTKWNWRQGMRHFELDSYFYGVGYGRGPKKPNQKKLKLKRNRKRFRT